MTGHPVHTCGGYGWQRLALALITGMVVLGAGCRTDAPTAGTAAVQAQPANPLAERWGIEITSVRLSANGHLVDFRYRVLDPDKAKELSDPESKPCLIDQATGIKLPVPRTPKIGPLRQTAQKPEAGRVYFLLFGNGSKVVKAGNKVTVVVGDFRVEDLEVQ